MKKILIITLLIFINYSCKSDKEKITKTTNELIESIRTENFNKFNGLIENSSTVRDDNYFFLLNRLYERSNLKENIIDFEFIDSIDHFGLPQKYLNIEYFKGYDSITTIESIELQLRFGPAELYSYDKISNYNIKLDWNKNERRKRLKLPELTKFQDSMKINHNKNIIEIPN